LIARLKLQKGENGTIAPVLDEDATQETDEKIILEDDEEIPTQSTDTRKPSPKEDVTDSDSPSESEVPTLQLIEGEVEKDL
jgi:hypothetical protein